MAKPMSFSCQVTAQRPSSEGLRIDRSPGPHGWDLRPAKCRKVSSCPPKKWKMEKNMTGFYIFYSFWWLLMVFFFMGLLYPDTRWHQPWSNIECPATSGAQYMAVPMRAVRRRCKPGHWRLPLGHGPGAPIRTTNHGLLILKACDFWIFLVRYV